MKPLTTSVYTFSKLIEDGFLYVDKTDMIHVLIERTGQFFLSRPRRFGKSLLMSTIKAIFQGRRELFAGLAIDSLDYDWQSYPVVHLDMGSCQADTAEVLNAKLHHHLEICASDYGIELTKDDAASSFLELITALSHRGRVVILIDEYDKPLLGHLGSEETAPAIQKVLKEFYSVVKSTEALQRFVLITGVSKFSRVSIFSDLNNLTDLTMSHNSATLLGYTQEELESNFPDYIDRLAKREQASYPQILERIRTWYNGYRFHRNAQTVYNPVSVMKCLQAEEFSNYWFETGTPTFLIELLKKQTVSLDALGSEPVAETMFSTYDVLKLEPLPLLVQTGYLTILGSEVLGEERYYYLGYPNREIEQSFSRWLGEGLCALPSLDLNSALLRLVKAFRAGDVDELFRQLQVFFANVPYTIQMDNEKYYQTIFFVIFKMVGAMVTAEVCTNVGRVDAVVETPNQVYLFEFKLHGTVEQALAQIRTRKYYQKYQNCGKTLLLIGAAFDPQTRNLEHWQVERLP